MAVEGEAGGAVPIGAAYGNALEGRGLYGQLAGLEPNQAPRRRELESLRPAGPLLHIHLPSVAGDDDFIGGKRHQRRRTAHAQGAAQRRLVDVQPTHHRAVLDIHGDEVIEKTQVNAGAARIIRSLAKFSGQIDGDAFQGGCHGQARRPVIRGKRNDGVKAEAAGRHPEVRHVGKPIDIVFGGVARYGKVDQVRPRRWPSPSPGRPNSEAAIGGEFKP